MFIFKEHDLIFNFVWKMKIFSTHHLKVVFDVVHHIERPKKKGNPSWNEGGPVKNIACIQLLKNVLVWNFQTRSDSRNLMPVTMLVVFAGWHDADNYFPNISLRNSEFSICLISIYSFC